MAHARQHSLVSSVEHSMSGLTIGHVLRADSATTCDFAAIGASDLPAGIDAAKIADGSVSNAEFQRLDGLSADIQTTLDLKMPFAGGTFTGSVTLSGTARVVEQMDIDLAIPRRPVANPPGEGNEGGFPTLDFNDTTDESIYVEMHLPHTYADAGLVHIHLDFLVDTAPASAANVVWAAEYKKVAHGDKFDFSTGTSIATRIAAVTTGTPANDKEIHEISDLALVTTGWVAGETIYMRLYRDANHGSDTFTGDARMIGEIHIEWLANKLGEAT